MIGLSRTGRIVLDLTFALMLLSGAIATVERRMLMSLIIVLTILEFTADLVVEFDPSFCPRGWDTALKVFCMAILVVMTLKQTFLPGAVNVHRVMGGVAAYLLIGVTWAFGYKLLMEEIPDAIHFQSPLAIGIPTGEPSRLIYFSFETLTTVSYGDAYPVHRIARSLTTAESLIGQLYPAILIASLVGMALQARFNPATKDSEIKDQALPDGRGSEATVRYSLYVQDKWQVRRNLTLSYGVRWEYFAPPVGDMQQYNATTNTMAICGSSAVPSKDCGTDFSKRLFAPRLGVAYRPSEGFVIRAGFGISYDPFFIGQQILRIYPNQISYSLTGPNSYAPVTTLSQGIPALTFPAVGSGIIPMPPAVSLNSMGNDYVRSYILNWNFMLQKQLKYGFVAQAGYVGTRQVHQQYEININNGNILGAGTAGEALNQEFGRTATTNFFEPFGHSHYDALQATLSRRFSGGYQLAANYSFSKSISLCCADSEDAGPQIGIPADAALNRAVEPYDRTQVFTLTGIAELPLGRGKKWLNHGGFVAALASGWQLNALSSLYTGLPFTVTGSSTSLNAPGNTQTADQVVPYVATIGGVGPGQSWFDPLAYRSVTQVRFGNSGYDVVRGPGQVNVDAALFRTFQVTERFRLQFRAQAFNLANHPHFANPASNAGSLVLNANGTINNLGGFTVISATTGNGREGVDQRVIELALRLSF